MSDHDNAATEHAHASSSTFLWFFFILVGITGIEVFLGYKELEPTLMLGLLLPLSFIKV